MRLFTGLMVLCLALCSGPAFAKDFMLLGVGTDQCKLGTGQIHQGMLPSRGSITVVLPNQARCSGKFALNLMSGNIATSAGMEGHANLTCTDGATLTAYPMIDTRATGHGRGWVAQTQKGRQPFYFVFSEVAGNARQLLKTFLTQENHPCAKSI